MPKDYEVFQPMTMLKVDTLQQRTARLLADCEIGPHCGPCALIRDLSAALVQAEQEKAGLKQALIEVDEMIRVLRLDMAAGRVKSQSEIVAEARFATQEATIRQVAQAMRDAILDGWLLYREVRHRHEYDTRLRTWLDTLRALLPTEKA